MYLGPRGLVPVNQWTIGIPTRPKRLSRQGRAIFLPREDQFIGELGAM